MPRERLRRARGFSAAAIKFHKRRCTDRSTVGLLRPTTVPCREPFRFLDLPGELRNNVYHFARCDAYYNFPVYPIREYASSTLALGDHSNTAMATDRYELMPYLGLVQSCNRIRREFYCTWLETHFIALRNTRSWLQAFFPAVSRRACTPHSSGTFSIFLTRDEVHNVDVLPVLKHIARFPDCKIHFHRDRPSVSRSQCKGLVAFLNNRHPKWERWVRNHVMSQVRLTEGKITVVVKERYATSWMKKTYPSPKTPADFLASMGLDKHIGWSISWAVDYS